MPGTPPLVTGISPKEGPPGTRVTIRGENLGVNAKDLIGLNICGFNCLLSAEWVSPHKILARTGHKKGRGDILVATHSGGVGSSTVQFKGYFVHTGPLQDSAVWVDESQSWDLKINRNRGMASPISGEHDDPLGISDESNDTKFPEDLAEMFPDGTWDTSQENFVPAMFLLQNHHGTSFDDLKAGLAYLKRKSSQSNEGPMAFFKSNLTTFMDCQDTLSDMHAILVADQQACKGGHSTQTLEEIIAMANKSADALFQDVLGRKDRADATRNALGVLHRFKFLFNLPGSLEKNIRKGDYDLVITDYTRAKSLFGDTEVQVFKIVYQEVERRIANFRETLTKKLLHLPISLDEQKKLIRYLVHLETPGDPAWECLVNMQKWLLALLNTCKDEHLAKDKESEAGKMQEQKGESKMSTGTVSREPSFKSGTKVPQKVLFVENLCRILNDHFPDLWRLGQAYFSGKLVKETKEKAGRIDISKHQKFKQMVLGVINQFSHLIRAAFLPESLENFPPKDREAFGVWLEHKRYTPSAWMPICVRYVRSCVSSLSSLDLSSDSMGILQDLTFDMRTSCMATLLTQAIKDIKNLHERETWSVDSDDKRGGTTLLPTLFENIVSETVQHLQEVLAARQGEQEMFEQRPIQKEAVTLCTQLLQAFAGTLEQLAVIGNVERDTKMQRSAVAPDMFSSSEFGEMPSLDKRLIIMMSNCTHTLEHILPRLVDLLERHGYPEAEKVLQDSEEAYRALDEKLFENYIEEKANPIVGVLEQNMYAGRFDWNDCQLTTGVRRYIKEALLGMIEVHAEVYAINPHFVPRVMSKIVEAVAEELSRLVQCVTNFSRNGALQARLELYAMELATSAYRTEGSCTAYKEAVDCLPALGGTEEKKNLEDLLNQFQTHMRFQLMCFQPDNSLKLAASA